MGKRDKIIFNIVLAIFSLSSNTDASENPKPPPGWVGSEIHDPQTGKTFKGTFQGSMASSEHEEGIAHEPPKDKKRKREKEKEEGKSEEEERLRKESKRESGKERDRDRDRDRSSRREKSGGRDSLPSLGTKAGCEDALNEERYTNKNLGQTLGKIRLRHMYNSTKDHPKEGEVQFDQNVVGNSNDLLGFINGHCEIDNALIESGRGDNAGACYFKCRKQIGMHWDDKSRKLAPTTEIKLTYKVDREEKDKYYLISIYPALPTALLKK